MFKKQLFVLVLILWVQNSSGFLGTLKSIISGVGMVVDFIKTLPSAVHSVKELISSFTSGKPNSIEDKAVETSHPTSVAQVPQNPNLSIKNVTEMMEKYHNEIVQRFEEIDVKLENLKLFVVDRFAHIQELIKNLPQQIDLMMKRQIIGEFIMAINQKWDRIMRFLNEGVDGTVYTHLMQIDRQYIDENLNKFRFSIIPLAELSSTAFGLLTDIATMQKDKRKILCNGETSHHSVINLFQMIIATEIKVYVLQALAYNEAFLENDGWKQLLGNSEHELEQQLKKYISDLKNSLKIEERPHIRACYSEDGQYHKAVLLPKVLQVRTLIPRTCTIGYKSLLACNEKCTPDLTSTMSCDDIDNCVVNLDRSRQIGRACKMLNDSDVEIIMAGVECTCLQYEKFILSTMQSRVNDNYVVVAVRFQKKNNYIYIQIAEGKLESNAYISNFQWIIPTRKKNGEDPFEASLTVNEGKTIALDDVQLPPWYILTGIKFDPQTISGDDGFKIGLYGVKFNYETGQLYQMDETFVLAPGHGTESTVMGRNQDSSKYTLAEFRTSNYQHSNSPRTLPDLNAAEVLPDPLSPIGGVGIFYEIAPNNISMLSLRLFTIEYMNFIASVDEFTFSSLSTPEDPDCKL